MIDRAMSLCGRGLLIAVAILWTGSAAEAQGRRTVLSVTGLPLSLTTTSTTDFDAGSATVGTVSFSVDLTTDGGGGGAFSTRVTTVQVRCGPICTGAFGRLQWRRNDLAVWNTLSTTFVDVETRTATIDTGPNDPWSNSIIFRRLLDYATDAPSGPTAFALEFQLVVTAP